MYLLCEPFRNGKLTEPQTTVGACIGLLFGKNDFSFYYFSSFFILLGRIVCFMTSLANFGLQAVSPFSSRVPALTVSSVLSAST